MDTWLPLGLRAVNGGLLVVAFTLLSQVLRPRRFAGIMSAAPAVAVANLLVVSWDRGTPEATSNALGMAAGAVALGVATLVGVALVRRHRALPASLGICALWAPVAFALGFVVR